MSSETKTGVAPPAVVALCIGEHKVDAVLESLKGSPVVRCRWFVVGYDMSLLGSLEMIWKDVVSLTIVGIPSGDLEDAEPIVTILEHEMNGVVSDCLWLFTSRGPPPPQDANFALNLDTVSVETLSVEIAGLMNGSRFFGPC